MAVINAHTVDPITSHRTALRRASHSHGRTSTGTVPLVFRNARHGVFRAETATHGYEVHRHVDHEGRITGYQALVMRRHSRHVLFARMFEFHQSATHWLGCECGRLEHGAE